MINNSEKTKKKLEELFDEIAEVNPDSDIPIAEKKVKDKKIKEF